MLRTNASRRRAFPASWRASAFLLLGVMAAGACGGDNLFQVGPIDGRPPEIQIVAPRQDETFPVGGEIPVSVLLRDVQSGIVIVEIAGYAAGDVGQGEPLWIERYEPVEVEFAVPVDSTTFVRTLQPAEGEAVMGERIHIRAHATNGAGVRDSAQDVVVSVGGPLVSMSIPGIRQDDEGPHNWYIDEQLQVSIAAIDPAGVGIDTVWLTMTGGMILDTAFALPPFTVADTIVWTGSFRDVGRVTVSARARSRAGVVGRAPRNVILDVVSTAIPDTIAPDVALLVETRPRMEYSDGIVFSVTANDRPSAGAGLERVGYLAYATIVHAGVSVQHRIRNVTDFGGAREQMVFADTVSISSIYAAAGLDPTILPLPGNVRIEVHAFARDTTGVNCHAIGATNMRDCLPVVIDEDTFYVAAGAPGIIHDFAVVAGRSVTLPGAGMIADAAVDTARGRMYLSNITRNRVETLDLSSFQFTDSARVGSEPWGLFIAGDTLLVANSGGTNIDRIVLNSGPLSLSPASRLRTPNVVLWQVNVVRDPDGMIAYTREFFDFSDKPQFVAQDSLSRILYSTVPTGTAPDGTIRVARFEPGWEAPSVEMLLAGEVVVPSEDAFAIWNVDDVEACHDAAGWRGIRIHDHIPGFPSMQIVSDCLAPPAAMVDIAAQGSDIGWVEAAAWDLSAVGLSDTTFVAASGDRGRIVFGEGAVEPAGRIMMWHAEDASVSGAIPVVDLIHNEPARVTGVDLNHDGRLGVARGEAGAYFFDDGLRLQGRFVQGMAGGAGAALHPLHTGTYPPADARMSFVGTANLSIKVIETYHFYEMGEIPIRDELVGPLRAVRVVGQTLPPDDPDYIVSRLFGVTNVPGGERAVVVIDVRRRDLTN